MLTGLTPANPLAIRICAPYGMSPWTTQEKVSSIEAVLRGEMLYFSEILRAILPTVMIAIVLLAVQRFMTDTRKAMQHSAPLRPRIKEVIRSI